MANKIKWTAAQEKRLADAVIEYNATVRAMKDSGLFDYVPKETSFSREKMRIENRWQLRTRIAQLERINADNAWNVVHPESDIGASIPLYLKKEIGYTVRLINKDRENTSQRVMERARTLDAPLTNLELGTMYAGKNLKPIDESTYYTSEDFEDLLNMHFEKSSYKVGLYVETWRTINNVEQDEVINIIQRFAEENPEALEEIWEGNYDEVEISYIYKNEGGQTGTYKGQKKTFHDSPFQYAIPETENERYNKVIRFWKQKEQEYFGD